MRRGTLPLVGAAATDCAFALAATSTHVVAETALNAAALSAAASPRAGSAQLLERRPPARLRGGVEQRRIPRRPAGGGGVSCLWSAACSPLRTASVDVAAVDPVGIAHKVDGFKGGLRALYAQLAEPLVSCGPVAALSASRPLATLEAPLATLGAFWDSQRALHVNRGGAFAWIVLWVRDAPWPAGRRRGGGAIGRSADTAGDWAGRVVAASKCARNAPTATGAQTYGAIRNPSCSRTRPRQVRLRCRCRRPSDRRHHES